MPEVRTSRGGAIVLCVATLFAVVISLTVGGSIEESLGSEGLALVILATWCLSGAIAGIGGIVDAYVRPEGEVLGVVVSVAATVFSVLAVIVVVALVFTIGDSFTTESET